MRRVGQFFSLLLILTAGVLWIASSSSAQDEARAGKGPAIKIRTDDGTKTVYFNDLEGVYDQLHQRYTLKDSDGKTVGHVTVNDAKPGYALGDIYKAAGVHYLDVDFVEIPRADGAGFVRLYGSQLNPNGSAFEKHRPVAIYKTSQTNGTLNFIRGLFKDDEDDANADDSFRFDGDPVIRNRTGVPLTVTVSASPTKPEAGVSVSFTATVDNDDYVYDYHWTFSDNNEGAENSSSVSHTFKNPEDGAFATVTVKARTDDSKGEGSITFNVKEHKDDTSSGTGYSGYDSGYSGYSSGYTSPTYTDPGTDYNIPDGTTDPSTESSTKPEEEADPAQTEPTGTPVSGELLQDAAVVPEGTAAPPPESSDTPEPTTPVPTVEKDHSAPTSVVTGMAVIGLLGFGAFTELGTSGSRSRRRRRLNPFRRGNK